MDKKKTTKEMLIIGLMIGFLLGLFIMDLAYSTKTKESGLPEICGTLKPCEEDGCVSEANMVEKCYIDTDWSSLSRAQKELIEVVC